MKTNVMVAGGLAAVAAAAAFVVTRSSQKPEVPASKPAPAATSQAPAQLPAPATAAAAPTDTFDPAKPSEATRKMRLEIESYGKAEKHTAAIEAKLVAALQHGDQDVRGHACWSLGRLAPASKAALPKLVAAMGDPVWAVRHNASWALKRFAGDGEAAFRRALGDKDERVRVRAAMGLVELGAKDQAGVESVLAAGLRAKDERIQIGAIAAIGSLQQVSGETVATLVKLLDHEDRRMRDAAVVSAGLLGSQAKPAVPGLLKLLKHEKKRVRMAAAQSLGRIGDSSPTVLAALVEQLGDKKDRAALGAAEALSRLGAIDALGKALASPSRRTRAAAAQALGMVKELDKPRVTLLLKALADKEWTVRIAGAAVFHGRPEDAAQGAVKALKKLSKDPNSAVAGQAKASLEQMTLARHRARQAGKAGAK